MHRIRRFFSTGRPAGDGETPGQPAGGAPDPRPSPEPQVAIRAMEGADLAGVHAIEEQSHPNAWRRADFVRWMEHTGVSTHVLEADGRLLGFFVVERRPDQLYVANIAVAPDARRRGLASRALRAIENIARAFALPRVVLDVRESNVVAQLCYRKAGYRATEVLRGHYGEEDGYRMVKPVPASAGGQPSSPPA